MFEPFAFMVALRIIKFICNMLCCLSYYDNSTLLHGCISQVLYIGDAAEVNMPSVAIQKFIHVLCIYTCAKDMFNHTTGFWGRSVIQLHMNCVLHLQCQRTKVKP